MNASDLRQAAAGAPASVRAQLLAIAAAHQSEHSPAPASRGGVAALRASRTPGEMTKTEARFARRLDAMKERGEILAWDYECDRLKLASAITGGRAKWFRVDFTVTLADGRLTYIEVKGGWVSDGGMERFRALCQQYPLRHIQMWQWNKGAWTLRLESGAPARAGRGE